MELKSQEFYILKGNKNYLYSDVNEAINQIKKDKDTECKLIKVDISEDEWKLNTVGWDEIAKQLLG